MRSYKDFYQKLMNKPSQRTVLKIMGKKKTIKAMARLTSKNYLSESGEYIKIYFKEDGYLLIIPGEKEVYFSDVLQEHIKEISDKDIGKKQIVEYKGKKYKLDNKNDYQFVLELLVGSPLDIEGEVRFSDYFPVEGAKEFLSLGWLVRTGKRADLHCELVDVGDIEIVKT
jgi:hypothetical protein